MLNALQNIVCNLNLDRSKILTSGNGFIDIGFVFVDRDQLERSGECRARSDCTYVPSDLALHSPHNKCRNRYLFVKRYLIFRLVSVDKKYR